ncbi:MAG: hypothetical protein ABUR63_06005 [Verrucomicrobiota bacterium]
MTAVRSGMVFGLLWAVTVAAGAGCGGKEPMPAADGGLKTGDLLPLKEGNKWTYRVTDSKGTVTMKTQTVMAQETVGGTGPNKAVMAFKLITQKHEGMSSVDETDSWQAKVGDTVVRYRELSYHATTGLLEQEEYWDPPKLRVDQSAARVVESASWLEVYLETKSPVGGVASTAEQHDLWTVVYPSQSVTVPAGTFNALVLQKVAGTVKNYWFVPGVGKVKETGDQSEELASFQVTP